MANCSSSSATSPPPATHPVWSGPAGAPSPLEKRPGVGRDIETWQKARRPPAARRALIAIATLAV
jgi:hypothetical protein